MKKMKRLFSLALVLTMGMGLVGCSSSANEEQITKETETAEKEKFKLPTETMSVEETQALEVGTEIMLEDLDKMPDEAILEEMNLSTAYLINNTFTDQKGKKYEGGNLMTGVLPDGILDTGYIDEPLDDGTTRRSKLVGITIAEVEWFKLDENGQWIKILTDGKYTLDGTPVVSEKLLNEWANYKGNIIDPEDLKNGLLF